MKTHFKQVVTIIISIFLLSCSTDETSPEVAVTPKPIITPPVTTVPAAPAPSINAINYLALGDSYTIGQNVCETCRFPEQLKASLSSMYNASNFSLKVIATTGWTTSNLISAVNSQNPNANYDLVTLLIGVNNQFQHVDFSVYEKEFPELVNKAIMLGKGDKKNVIVVSIPDYAYTPYGMSYNGETGRAKISAEITQYNTYAENYCTSRGVVFVSITDITRQGLNNTSLVASDGLHPSAMAYKMFVDRILPKAKIALED